MWEIVNSFNCNCQCHMVDTCERTSERERESEQEFSRPSFVLLAACLHISSCYCCCCSQSLSSSSSCIVRWMNLQSTLMYERYYLNANRCDRITFQQILRDTVAARNRVDLLNRNQLSPRQEYELQRYIDGNAFVLGGGEGGDGGGGGGSGGRSVSNKSVSWYSNNRPRSSSPPMSNIGN